MITDTSLSENACSNLVVNSLRCSMTFYQSLDAPPPPEPPPPNPPNPPPPPPPNPPPPQPPPRRPPPRMLPKIIPVKNPPPPPPPRERRMEKRITRPIMMIG